MIRRWRGTTFIKTLLVSIVSASLGLSINLIILSIISLAIAILLVVVLSSAIVNLKEYHLKLVKYYFTHSDIRFKSNLTPIIFLTLNYLRFRYQVKLWI